VLAKERAIELYHSRFKGNRYDAGYKYGNILFNKGVVLKNIFTLTPEKIEFGSQCMKEYERAFPGALEEMRGLADGWRSSLEDLSAFLLGMYCMTFDNKCSCFAWSDSENILFGRNSDFLTELEDSYESCFYRLDGGYSFIGNTTAMVQMEDGVNEHGLAVGLTFIYPLVFRPGLNAGMLTRYILEKCKTVKQALEVLQRLPIASAQTITMLDKTGDMAVVECNCEKIAIIRPEPGRGFVAATNQFVSKEMKQYAYSGPDEIHSGERYRTLTDALGGATGCSLDFAMGLLSGKYGFMCQYEREKGLDTVWSTIYDLKNFKVYRAEGNPSRKGFQEDRRLKFV
jgi:predicted choloylglycine hydrolase